MRVEIQLLKDHPHLRPEPGEVEPGIVEVDAVNDDLPRLDRF